MISKAILILLAICLAQLSIAQGPNLHPNFKEITKDHKVIAILPFVSSLKLRKRQEGKMSESEKNTLLTTYRYQAQKDFYANFVERKSKKGSEIGLQPIDKTNELLKEHKIDLDSLENIDKVKLAQLLGVDAVLIGKIEWSKPHPLFSQYSSSQPKSHFNTIKNVIQGNLCLYDGKQGSSIWKFSKIIFRGVESGVYSMITTFTRKAVKNLPYKKEK